MSDPIGDMIARIRNGYLARHQEVRVPYSKKKAKLAEILVEEGYLKKMTVGSDEKKNLILALKYKTKKPVVTEIKRVSKPGRRIYIKAKQIKPILSGLGVGIISTPVGLITNREARKKKLGGEVICHVW